MKIAVIGPGGVGGFLGALLSRGGHDVTFLGRGEHLAAIRSRGLTVKSVQFGDFTVRVAATDRASDLGSNDIVLVGVKMYDFADACAAAATALAPNGIAVPIQNGLEAPDLLAAAVGTGRAVTGSVGIEAAIAAPGAITHSVPTHWLSLGELSGPPGERLKVLAATLQQAQITVRLAADGRQALWDKAAMLIPFATLTSAADCGLGEIWDIPTMKAVWARLAEEAIAVAAAEGYDVRPALNAAVSMFVSMLPAAAAFTSSMNRDFRAGRRNELEWLTGTLLRRASARNVPVAAHEALYGILQLRSQRQAGAARA